MRAYFIFSILILTGLMACNNEAADKKATDTTSKTSVVPPAYDLNADTSVFSGEMKRYWLVLLKRGNNRNQNKEDAAKIQERHIANIERLAKEGKIIMAGPIGIDGDLRGIFIMNCADSTEVESLVKTDTAVITGRLKMEYYPWWSEKGKFIFK